MISFPDISQTIENTLPDYLLAAIAEFDEAPETECAAAFERMKDALGKAIVEAEG